MTVEVERPVVESEQRQVLNEVVDAPHHEGLVAHAHAEQEGHRQSLAAGYPEGRDAAHRSLEQVRACCERGSSSSGRFTVVT
ncbi:MAG: hypothetical protein GX643_04435 [Acidimicrobiales bacterium]|nr:hypothetical protein [Acidimicrobiales bacterium]